MPRKVEIWLRQSNSLRYMEIEYWPIDVGHRIADSEASFSFSHIADGAQAQPTR